MSPTVEPSADPTVSPTSKPTYLSTINPDLFTCSPYSASLTSSALVNYATCKFTGCGSSTLIIAANCPCSGDTYARLYDSTNSILLAANDDSCGLCSKITYVVPGSPSICTDFYLHEGCYSSGSCSGTFTIQSQRSPTAFPTFTPKPTSVPTSSPTFLPSAVPSGPSSTPTLSPTFNVGKCYTGNDLSSPYSSYVVCDVNPQRAWLSFINSYSYYHIDAICKSLGYSGFGQVGGNCGSVCGYCDDATGCDYVGQEIYDGGGYLYYDEFGEVYGDTVTWSCVNVQNEPTAEPTFYYQPTTDDETIEPTSND
jgi:hypothetical protein